VNIYQLIESISKEKGIDPAIVVEAVKDAMLAAARKQFQTDAPLEVELDPETSGIRIFALKEVAEPVEDPKRQISLREARQLQPDVAPGMVVRVPLNTQALGRIAAEIARQIIIQKVREAERERIYQEYAPRVGELVQGTVKRVEGPDLIVDLGNVEARLPRKEQSRADHFTVGDRIRCVIKSVERSGRNAGVTVSRAAPELVVRLFEQEVPEIYDGTVIIKACAREPGERTKIAVQSRDRDVDPVGACVGMRGMRVQSIMRELRGEKIDIIQYSDDPVEFARNALSPARISKVTILDPEARHMEVIVEESQLSLAIGKRGQNVRLASRLLGWNIDIKTEEEKRREVESQMEALVAGGAPVSVLVDYGVSEELIRRLSEAGVNTVEQLGLMTPEQLEEIEGVTPEVVSELQQAVIAYYEQFQGGVETASEQAETAGVSGVSATAAGLDEQAVPQLAPGQPPGEGPGVDLDSGAGDEAEELGRSGLP